MMGCLQMNIHLRISNIHGENLVGSYIFNCLLFCRYTILLPPNPHSVHFSQSKMSDSLHTGQITPVRIVFINLLLSMIIINMNDSAQSVYIFFVAFEFNLKKMVFKLSLSREVFLYNKASSLILLITISIAPSLSKSA